MASWYPGSLLGRFKSWMIQELEDRMIWGLLHSHIRLQNDLQTKTAEGLVFLKACHWCWQTPHLVVKGSKSKCSRHQGRSCIIFYDQALWAIQSHCFWLKSHKPPRLKGMVYSPHYLIGGASKNLGAMRLKGVKENDKFQTWNWDLVLLNSMYRPLVSHSGGKLRFSWRTFLGVSFNNKQKKLGEML